MASTGSRVLRKVTSSRRLAAAQPDLLVICGSPTVSAGGHGRAQRIAEPKKAIHQPGLSQIPTQLQLRAGHLEPSTLHSIVSYRSGVPAVDGRVERHQHAQSGAEANLQNGSRIAPPVRRSTTPLLLEIDVSGLGGSSGGTVIGHRGIAQQINVRLWSSVTWIINVVTVESGSFRGAVAWDGLAVA